TVLRAAGTSVSHPRLRPLGPCLRTCGTELLVGTVLPRPPIASLVRVSVDSSGRCRRCVIHIVHRVIPRPGERIRVRRHKRQLTGSRRIGALVLIRHPRHRPASPCTEFRRARRAHPRPRRPCPEPDPPASPPRPLPFTA